MFGRLRLESGKENCKLEIGWKSWVVGLLMKKIKFKKNTSTFVVSLLFDSRINKKQLVNIEDLNNGLSKKGNI